MTVTTLRTRWFPPWRIMFTTCRCPTFTTFSLFTCGDTAAAVRGAPEAGRAALLCRNQRCSRGDTGRGEQLGAGSRGRFLWPAPSPRQRPLGSLVRAEVLTGPPGAVSWFWGAEGPRRTWCHALRFHGSEQTGPVLASQACWEHASQGHARFLRPPSSPREAGLGGLPVSTPPPTRGERESPVPAASLPVKTRVPAAPGRMAAAARTEPASPVATPSYILLLLRKVKKLHGVPSPKQEACQLGHVGSVDPRPGCQERVAGRAEVPRGTCSMLINTLPREGQAKGPGDTVTTGTDRTRTGRSAPRSSPRGGGERHALCLRDSPSLSANPAFSSDAQNRPCGADPKMG